MKKSVFDPSLIILLVVAIALVIAMPSIVGTINSKNTYVVSQQDLQFDDYGESVSDVAMCNLASEVYIGLIGKSMTMFMEIEDNKVSGWQKICDSKKESGFEWALWVNKYNSTTFCLSFAGTDQFKDTLQYIDMETDENKATQMHEAIETTKNIYQQMKSWQNFEGIDQFYITGHSLGGYLAMFVASELVDAQTSSDNDLSIQDIGLSNIGQLHCVTFGAPGMYLTGTFPKVELTSWEKVKKQHNEDKLYNLTIKNYVNDLDPVGTLLPDYLVHLGQRIDLTVKRSPISAIFKFLKNSGSLTLYAVGVTPSLYYHMPWVYVSNIKNRV